MENTVFKVDPFLKKDERKKIHVVRPTGRKRRWYIRVSNDQISTLV